MGRKGRYCDDTRRGVNVREDRNQGEKKDNRGGTENQNSNRKRAGRGPAGVKLKRYDEIKHVGSDF